MSRKLLLFGFFLTLAAGFAYFPQSANALPSCVREDRIDDWCMDEDPPAGPIIESLGTEKTVSAALSSDGSDRDKLYLWVFPGNAGQVWKIDYENRRNDNPTPGIEACVNSTSVWGQGRCHTFQEWKSGVERTEGAWEVASRYDYTYLSHFLVKLRVDQTTFNENDVAAEFVMHRREFNGWDSHDVDTPTIPPGSSPRFSWDSNGFGARKIAFAPDDRFYDDLPDDASGFAAYALNNPGTHDYQFEFSGPARYGGENKEIWNPVVTVQPGTAPPPPGGGGGGTGRFKCGGNDRCYWDPDDEGPNQGGCTAAGQSCDGGGSGPPGNNPVCGDGDREGSEQCDNGSNNGACPRTCSNSCTTNTCAAANCSQFISGNLPTTRVGQGTTFPVSATFRNCGTSEWTNALDFNLGDPMDGAAIWGTARVDLPQSVSPGTNVTFNFNATAPNSQGNKNWAWRMVKDSWPGQWFGDYWSGTIEVGPGSPSAPQVNGINGVGNCTVQPTWNQGTISWTGTSNPVFGFYVDISDDPSFNVFYNKMVPNGNSTDLNGFQLYGGTDILVLQTDRTYYTRIYNGYPTANDHSPTTSFMRPYCRKNVCTTTPVAAQCTNIIGTGSNDCTVANDCPPPPPSCDMSAAPGRIVIPPPQSSTITWTCNPPPGCPGCPPGSPPPPPGTCTLTGFGSVPWSGQVTVTPTSTMTYTLNCSNTSGNDTVGVTVRTFDISSGTLKEIPPP